MYILPGYTEYYEKDGAVFVASKLFRNEVKITDPTLKKEFYALVNGGGCLDLSSSLTRFLHEQELLVNPTEIMETLMQTKRMLEEVLLLTIIPTEGCNFRCPYCYENHVLVTMCREVLEQIKAYIAEQAKNFKKVQVSWFGGEPTLCENTVLDVSKFVQNLSVEYPFEYTAGMTTNGYLLNIETFQRLYSAGITSYQITLDGWNHDKTRPHISGKGTLKDIVTNLIAISSLPRELYRFRILLRHNILEGDEDFSWYDYLCEVFGKDDRFSVMVRAVGDWGGKTVHSLDVLKGNEREEVLLKHIQYLKKIGMKCENGRQGMFSKICYASFPHSMVFRASGKIEKCTVCLDHPKNLLGWVDRDKGIVLNDKINELWSSSDIKPECYKCSDVLSCFNLKCKKLSLVDKKEERDCSRISSEIY